jgi:hypothetical protein
LAIPDSNAPLPERVWALKPWWCQPWSILATGTAMDFCSWWLLRMPWLTGLLVLAVALWWWLFLVLMPAQWTEMVRSQAEQAPGEAATTTNGDGGS